MSEALMELSNVRFGYDRRVRVIDRINARVQPGCLHTLIGPNASGKSTLIKLMLGQLKPDRGRVTFEGQKVHRMNARHRARQIAYVPQRSSVIFSYTVQQVVAMGRFALKTDHAAIRNALQSCDLGRLANTPFSQLSAGQQQRVLMARAIAQSTGGGRIVLLDEPTSAMDLAHMHQTMNRLKQLAAQGLAVVAVVHDLNLAARYADRVWLLDQGKLVADGPWTDIMHPAILEPVYGVRLQPIQQGQPDTHQRPVFDVRLQPTDRRV